MIEPTDEMIERAGRAMFGERPLNPIRRRHLRDVAAAVLAIVEQHYDVTPKLPPVEHRMRGEVWWNHSAEAYQAECACGEEFTGWPRSDAEERLLDHLERELGRG